MEALITMNNYPKLTKIKPLRLSQFMKIKKVILLGLLIIASGYQFKAVAHSNNNQSLKKESTALTSGPTDLWVISCSNDGNGPTAYLKVQLQATPATHLQISRNQQSISVTGVSTAQGKFSKTITLKPVKPGTTVNDGNGDYLVMVNKSQASRASYSFDYHCMTASGGHTGTDISAVQNQ